MVETKNAIITDANIFIEDHGILTFFIYLDYGNVAQGFGGYDVRTNLGEWIENILKTFEVTEWGDLKGKPCRAQSEHSKIHTIGHLIKDKWVKIPK